MKKIFSFAAIAAVVISGLTMTACSNEAEMPMPSEVTNAMRFGVLHTNPTRGIPTTSTNIGTNMPNFQVWGYFTGEATGEGVTAGGLYVGKDNTTGIVINQVTEGSWDYANPLEMKYWPATTAGLNFQAVTPASDPSFTIENTPADNLAHLTAVVTVPTDVTAQKDIMFAKADNQNRGTNGQQVALAFNHGLSQVVFAGKLASQAITAEVSEISIVNVHAAGKVGYFAADASLGATVTDEASATYSLGIAAENTLTDENAKNLTADNGALLMLPQTVTAWTTASGTPVPTTDADAAHNSYLKIKCTITDKLSNVVLINDGYIYLPFEIAWEQGKKYTYTLVFGNGSGGFDEDGDPIESMLPITYTVSIANEWVGVDGGESTI